MREDETQFRALVDQGVAVIFVIQDDMTIGYENRHFIELLGYTPEEMIGRPLLDFVAEASRAAVTSAAQELFSGKTPSVQMVATIKRKDGGLVDLLAHGAMAGFRGRPAIFGVAIDITERRRADEARAQLAAIVESSGSAIISADRNGICTSWNIGAEQIYGYSAEEMIGQPVAVLVPKERRGELRDLIAKVLSGGDIVNFETVRLHKSGRPLDLSQAISPIRNSSGSIVGASAIVIDIGDRKRAERALQRTARTLKTLTQANHALVRAASQDDLFREMCRVIVDVGGYRMAWIGFAEQDADKTVRPIAWAGHDEGFLDQLRLSWADSERGQTPVGTAIRTGSLQLNRDFATNPLMSHLRAEAHKRGYRSSIALPLRETGRVFAAIAIYARERDAFNADEVQLLTELADDLSYGVTGLRAHTDHEAALQRLERAMEETVQVVASTVEMRDSYTAGHQRRVARIAEAIAVEMGLSDDRIHGLRLASIVHDLGKIHIPAEILSKPGKLTPAEYELIKMHPQVGYDILKPVEFPWPIADIVLQHHERLDGSGYPNGLKGDAILLEARIMAVADVVESMISHRPYRPALGIDTALAEIEGGKGRTYDAAVVEAYVRQLRAGNLELD
ncbi:MAG: PAS domain S-box protein [Alphaproteobacteria bacterium]